MHFKSKGSLQMRRSQLRHFLKGSWGRLCLRNLVFDALRGCQVDDLKKVKRSEVGYVDSASALLFVVVQ